MKRDLTRRLPGHADDGERADVLPDLERLVDVRALLARMGCILKNPDVTFRAMTPDDVPRLQALMRRCYGESYFDGIYYDADALRLLISEGKQYSAIALNESGEVVAHIGLRNPRRGRTADSTMAIVDPRYRSRGLLDFIISDQR